MKSELLQRWFGLFFYSSALLRIGLPVVNVIDLL